MSSEQISNHKNHRVIGSLLTLFPEGVIWLKISQIIFFIPTLSDSLIAFKGSAMLSLARGGAKRLRK